MSGGREAVAVTRAPYEAVRPSPWIRRFHVGVRPGKDVPVLVVLPHAGGNASFYQRLSADLAGYCEVLVMQYPGRQDRLAEPVPPTLNGMLDGIEEALLPWRDRPSVLFGHSMGALLAFELARRWERADAGPRGLVLSGRNSPLSPEGPPPALDDESLIARMGALAGTEPELLADATFRELILPSMRGDYTALSTHRYEPGPLLHAPVSVLCGDEDPRADEAESMRWRELTRAAFTFRAMPGGHFYLVEQHEAVARAVREDLAGFLARD
ncbi:thioesterase II family protein [Streptomyces sp. NPDC101733]|uniref:thioesterase II family protein n=1 Tax=unclassified Streptomyces TaxID=2593676 RepID=UPI00381EF594